MYNFPLQQNKMMAVEKKTIYDYLYQHSKMNINRMLNVAVPNTG